MGMPISMEAKRDSRYRQSFSLRLLAVSGGEAAEPSLLSRVSDS